MWRSGLPRKPNITCSPREYFADEYGRTWRFADRSGSKDPLNGDVFRGALGSIVRKPTRAIIGEAGPEAVLPLSGNTTSFSATTINITVNANTDPREIAAAVERVIDERNRRAAVV
jgi:hypothetical protein